MWPMRDMTMTRRRFDIPPSRRNKGGGGGGSGNTPGGGGPGAGDEEPVPPGYETKFAEFIRMIAQMKGEARTVHVNHPAVLGADYAELVESLSRLAEADLSL